MYLPDINVWLALAFPTHQHHLPALAWYDGSPTARPCHFCRFSQMGFLRISNNPKAFPTSAMTQAGAWKLYDEFLSRPRIDIAPEPLGIDAAWRHFSQLARFSPNVLNDAYLAAFAMAGGYEVVTFDQGFKQFPGLNCTILS